MPLPGLLELVPLVYESGFTAELPAVTDGLLNVAVLPVDGVDADALCLTSVTPAELFLTAALLTADPLLLLLVALLRVVVPLPVVPRLVLELMPEPLLNVVRPLSAKTRVSLSVSYLGTYTRFFEMCPPWPIPGPPWKP